MPLPVADHAGELEDAKAAATKTCDAQATEKKVAEAAKTSFTKECVTDAASAAK